MRRRKLLTTLAISTVAGCVNGISGDENTEKTDSTGPETTGHQSETSNKTEISELSDQTEDGMYPDQRRASGLEVTLESWWGEKSLRYYDETEEQLKLLNPSGS